MRHDNLLRSLAFVAVLLGVIWANPSQANAPVGQYVVSNGTVVDMKSQLTWEQSPPGVLVSFDAAKAYCSGLGLDGGNWRVPSVKELQSIVDETKLDPCIDETVFPQTQLDKYWASNVWAADSTQAWAVRFDYASTNVHPVSDLYYVRCVR